MTPRIARERLRKAQGNICAGCGHPFLRRGRVTADDPLAPTFDHYIPRSSGGTSAASNGLLKHAQCNAARGSAAPTGCDTVWLEVRRVRFSRRVRSESRRVPMGASILVSPLSLLRPE